jgi:hypothetical protein
MSLFIPSNKFRYVCPVNPGDNNKEYKTTIITRRCFNEKDKKNCTECLTAVNLSKSIIDELRRYYTQDNEVKPSTLKPIASIYSFPLKTLGSVIAGINISFHRIICQNGANGKKPTRGEKKNHYPMSFNVELGERNDESALIWAYNYLMTSLLAEIRNELKILLTCNNYKFNHNDSKRRYINILKLSLIHI